MVRGLARGLGVVDPVTSPSFTLMHEYLGRDGRTALYHFDAWMAGREAAFLESGGADVLGGDVVCAVEWAGQVEAWLPAVRLDLRLEHRGPVQRRLLARVRGGAGLEAALGALDGVPGLEAER